MSEDFVVFSDANVLIAASIFGNIGPLKNVQHIHYSVSCGLLSKLCHLQQMPNPASIGYVSPMAEYHARKQLDNAVRDVVNRHWKDYEMAPELKEQKADFIHTLVSKSSVNLDRYLYALIREPSNKKMAEKIKRILRYEFDNLNPKVKIKKTSYLGSLIPKIEGISFSRPEPYLPGVEDEDLVILADAILMSRKLKRMTYVASLNTTHIASKVAMAMLEKKFGIRVRTPDVVLRTVNKRYGHDASIV